MTLDKMHAAVVYAVEEKKLHAKKSTKWGRKHKAPEIVSESDESNSKSGSDPIV